MTGTAGMYHINAKGEIRKCHATVRPCRYSANGHYHSLEGAKTAMEEASSRRTGKQSTPLSKKNKVAAKDTTVTTHHNGTKKKDADMIALENRALSLSSAMEQAEESLEGASEVDVFSKKDGDWVRITPRGKLWQKLVRSNPDGFDSIENIVTVGKKSGSHYYKDGILVSMKNGDQYKIEDSEIIEIFDELSPSDHVDYHYE